MHEVPDVFRKICESSDQSWFLTVANRRDMAVIRERKTTREIKIAG